MTVPPNPFPGLIECRLPLQQAGMGRVSTLALAQVVSGKSQPPAWGAPTSLPTSAPPTRCRRARAIERRGHREHGGVLGGQAGRTARVLRSSVESGDDPPDDSPVPPSRGFSGGVESGARYAGRTSVGAPARVVPAAALTDELFEAATSALDEAAGTGQP